MNLIERAMAQSATTDLNLTLTNSNTDFNTLIGKIINWIGIIAGVIAFFYLIYSGILYLTAGGNADQTKKAQQGIVNALIGIIIIVLAYAIVSAVSNQFTSANLGAGV